MKLGVSRAYLAKVNCILILGQGMAQQHPMPRAKQASPFWGLSGASAAQGQGLCCMTQVNAQDNKCLVSQGVTETYGKCPDLPAALCHLITNPKSVSGELLTTDLATMNCSRALGTRLESSSPAKVLLNTPSRKLQWAQHESQQGKNQCSPEFYPCHFHLILKANHWVPAGCCLCLHKSSLMPRLR